MKHHFSLLVASSFAVAAVVIQISPRRLEALYACRGPRKGYNGQAGSAGSPDQRRNAPGLALGNNRPGLLQVQRGNGIIAAGGGNVVSQGGGNFRGR